MAEGARTWYSKEIGMDNRTKPAVAFNEVWWVGHNGGFPKSRHHLGFGKVATVESGSSAKLTPGWVCWGQVSSLRILVNDRQVLMQGD